MTEIGTSSLNADILFTELGQPNPIEDSRKKALAYQSILRAWTKEVGHDEMDTVIDQAIDELDADLTSLYKMVRVTGNVSIKSIDVRGVIENEDYDEDDDDRYVLDPSAIHPRQQFLDDEPLQSLGYTVDFENDELILSHLARTEPNSIISMVKYGDISRTERVYIPIDGTALIEPEKDPNRVDIELLEYHVPELLSDVEIALFNAESLSESFQMLGQIELEPYKILDSNRNVALELGKYINSCLDIPRTAIYSVTGADRIRVQGSDGEFITGEIDPSLTIAGNIIGTGVDYTSNRLVMITSMPFSDDSQRPVLYSLGETISISEHTVFSL